MSGQHRGATAPLTGRAARALLVLLGTGAALLVAVVALTSTGQDPAPASHNVTVTVTATATVGTHTATATATATAAPGIVPCTEEDGSAPGQSFPCAWTGGPNGLGSNYVLAEPADESYGTP